MERTNYESWSELAYDPARLQRIAESERHEAVDSIFKDLLNGLRQRFSTSSAKADVDAG